MRAFALVMVLEGVLPFLLPEKWREMVLNVARVDARNLRLFGGLLTVSYTHLTLPTIYSV